MNNKQFRPYGTIGHPLRVWSRLLMQPTGSCLTLRAINLARLIDQNSGIVALTHAAGAHELDLTTQQFRDLIAWALKIQLVELAKDCKKDGRVYRFGALYEKANWEELSETTRASVKKSKAKPGPSAVRFAIEARAALKRENQLCSTEHGEEAHCVLQNRALCSPEHSTVVSGTQSQGQTPCAATGLERETTTKTSLKTPEIKDSSRELLQVVLEKARGQQQAEVEQQASASGSGPAEISEQPEQPDQVNQPEQLEQQEQPEVDYVLLDLPFLELADPRAFDTREWGQLSREEREQLSSVIPFDRYGELWVEQVCYSFWYAGVDGENNRLLLSHPSDRYYSLELTTANNSSTVEPTDIEQPLSNSSSNELQKGDLVLFNDREYVVSQKLGWDNDQCQLTSINTGRSITVDKDTIKLLKKAQQLNAQD